MHNFYLKRTIVRALFLMVIVAKAGTAFSQTELITAKTDSVAAALKADSVARSTRIFLLNKTQQKSSLLQATATVYTPQLVTTPAPSFLQALPGKLSGLYTRQRSGVQDADNPAGVIDFKIRGQIPLILVDGVPRSFSSIDPESIESITVLKDALSTVMFGQQSSNNMILVTTKRPVATPFKLSATVQHGVESLINLPKVVSAADYAILYNEARNNDGQAPVYSAADIAAYKNGTDPLGHPDNNYQNLFLNKTAPLSRYNVNIQNGNDVARFYVALDYQNEGGFFKTSGINSYNTNTDIDRYIVRSNVSVDLNKSLNVSLNLFGRIQSANFPGNQNTSGIFTAIETTPNNAYNIFNADGSLGGNTKFTNNISGLINNSGYSVGTTRDLSADVDVTQKLNTITPGLWLKATVSYNNTVDQTVNRSKTFAIYSLQNPGATTPVYNPIGTTSNQSNAFAFNSRRTYTYDKLSLGYDQHYGENTLSIVALADRQSTTSDLLLPAVYTNFAGNVTYNIKEKYFAEAAVSYGGYNRFKPGNQYGVFYALGLGWNIAKEKFMQDASWINVLKPRINYGHTGNVNTGLNYYGYDQYYSYGGTTAFYYFGSTPTTARGYEELVLANPNATWEKANKLNIGFDATLFNNHLTITSEYFRDSYSDLMQTRGTSSLLVGQDYPLENIGRNRYTGFENSIGWNGKSNNLSYFVNGNISLLKSKVLYQDEVYRPYAYQQRTGLPVGQAFGYIATGFFQSQADINASARVDGYNPVPGDIKYKDLNNDGVINQYDETAIGTQKPLIYFGLTTGFSIKGFDLSVSLQGVANNDVILTGAQEYEFQSSGNGQAFQHQLNRWTPLNAANATYPRLSIGTNVNNQRNSTFWLHSADYIRLQNVDLGYNIPASLVHRFKIDGVRIFANGFNLYSFSSLDHTDPENNGSVYPLRRTFNAGINIKL